MELGITCGRVSAVNDINDWDTLAKFIYSNINCIGKYKNAIIRKMNELPVMLNHSLAKLLVTTVVYSGINARDTAEILMEFAANAELPDIYPKMNEFDVAVIMCSSFHKLNKWIEKNPETTFDMIIDILAEGCPSGIENLNLIKDFISMNYTDLISLKTDAKGSLAEVEAKFNSFNITSRTITQLPFSFISHNILFLFLFMS